MIIGITGWFASGKDTVADYLVKKGFKSFSLSDVLREELRKEGKEVIRQNLLAKGNELRAEFGPGCLAERALVKIEEFGGNWVVPAIRQMGEVKALRQNKDFVLWEVLAPIDVRFDRMKRRGKGGEDDAIKSIEELKAREDLERSGAENAPQIDLVTAEADVKIDNSGNFKDLYHEIDKILEEHAQE